MSQVRATVRDIARAAGVSPASVSRALNNPEQVSARTRDRIEGAVSRLQGKSGDGEVDTMVIGLLFVDETCGPRFSGFDASLWAGISQSALTFGAEVLLLNMERRREGESVATICRRRGVSALAVRVDDSPERVLAQVADAGVPAVTIAYRHEHPAVGYVCAESRATSRQAIDHLVHLGHSRIAFCCNRVNDQDHEDRRLGFVDAVNEHGLDVDDSLMIGIPADAEGGVTAINRMLSMPRPPTAAYFADPLSTIGALRRLAELGVRVPAEFSVVGFDDDNARLLGSPVFTAVRQDVPELARLAGRLLCRMVLGGGREEPPRIRMQTYLEVNATTGPVPKR